MLKYIYTWGECQTGTPLDICHKSAGIIIGQCRTLFSDTARGSLLKHTWTMATVLGTPGWWHLVF